MTDETRLGVISCRLTDEAPKTIVCTLDTEDQGEACRYCGYPSGSGHGKQQC